MKRVIPFFIITFALFCILAFPSDKASAEKITYMQWGKIQLKGNQIGKLVIKKDIRIYKLDIKTNKITKVGVAKKGQEYGVYAKRSYKTHGVMFGIGSGKVIKYNSNQVTYKTAPKSLTEVIGKDRVWLYRYGLYVYGGSHHLPNLTEAIIISKKKDIVLDDYTSYKLKLKVGNKYFDTQTVATLNKYYITKNPFKTYKYDKKTWDLIKKSTIQIGMTKNQVRLSWGVPDDINSSADSYGATEQWIYGEILDDPTYLYFENGKLDGWQDY